MGARLAVSGEVATVARRHAGYFVDLVEQAEPELRQSQQWRFLESEHDNLQAALTWSLAAEDGMKSERRRSACAWVAH